MTVDMFALDAHYAFVAWYRMSPNVAVRMVAPPDMEEVIDLDVNYKTEYERESYVCTECDYCHVPTRNVLSAPSVPYPSLELVLGGCPAPLIVV